MELITKRSSVQIWNWVAVQRVEEVTFWLLVAGPLAWFVLSPPTGALSYVALAYVLLAPGMIMLGFPTRLYLPIVASVTLVFPFSVALAAIVASYLNFTLFGFDHSAPLIAVLLLSLALRLLAARLYPAPISQAWRGKSADLFLLLAVLTLAALALAITIDDDILGVYLPSFDPWKDAIGPREILARDLTPLSHFRSIGGYTHVYHGFAYLLTFMHTATGLDVYPLQRFDGAIALAGTVVFASLAMRTVTNSSLGLIAGPLIAANPFLIGRFTVPFKEDVAVAMLMVLLFLIASAMRSTDRRPYVVPVAVAFAAIIQFHPLTLAIAVLFLAVLVLSIFFTAGPEHERPGFPLFTLGAISLGTVLSAPSAYRAWLNLYGALERRAPVSSELLVVGIIGAALAALALVLLANRFRGFRPGLVTALVPAALVAVLVIGVVNVGVDPLGRGSRLLGTTNPAVTRVMFAPAVLLLLPGGLALLALRQHRDSRLRILLAFGVAALLIANLPNFGVVYQAFRTVIYLSIAAALLGAAYVVTLARSGAGRVFVPVVVAVAVAASTTSGSLVGGTSVLWNENDIAAVRALETIRANAPGPILPHPPDAMLLDYLGVTSILGRGRVRQAFHSVTFSELQQTIREVRPAARRAYLFFSREKPSKTWSRFDAGVRERLLQRPDVEIIPLWPVKVYVVPLPVVAPCPRAVPWENAGSRAKELVTVRGPVVRARTTAWATFLDVGQPGAFSVVIRAQDEANFPASLEEAYLGKTICVRGLIGDFGGVPTIVLQNPDDIAIQEPVVAPCPRAVPWEDVGLHAKELATVRGPVVGIHTTAWATFLGVGQSGAFSVVIQAENRASFPVSLEEAYLGKTICVRGLIGGLGGVPIVGIQNPDDIAVEEPTESSP